MTAPPLPHPAAGQTAPASLGGLILLAQRRQARRGAWLALYVVGTLFILAVFGYGLWRRYYGYTRFGATAAEIWSRPWLTLSAIGGSALILLLLRQLRREKAFIALHENGIRIRVPPADNHSLRWEDIESLISGSVRGHLLGLRLTARDHLIIHPRHGPPLSIDDRFANLSDLSSEIKARFYGYLRPNLSYRLENDHWIPFGPLSLHRKALRVHDQRIPWERVALVTIQDGSLVIELKTGRDLRLPAAKVPNLELFIQLVRGGNPT